MGVLSGLKPEKVFYYFEELHMVPIIQNRSVIIWYSLQKNVTWSAVRMTATML